MRRWLSGLRRTIGNRVTVNPVRRFKSSSPRQKNVADSFNCPPRFLVLVLNIEEDLRTKEAIHRAVDTLYVPSEMSERIMNVANDD